MTPAAGRGYRCRYLPSRPAGARVRCSGHRARPCASATADVRHAGLHCVPPLGKARTRRLDVGVRAVHARLGHLCGCGVRCAVCRALRDLSRIAHVHARNPNDSRRRPSTPIACICVNEPKRSLSGGSCLHHTAMTYSVVTQPASSTPYADCTRRLTYRRSRVK